MQARLKEWMRIVSRQFPHLSLPQGRGLASWSFGIALSQSSSLSRVSQSIAQLNDLAMDASNIGSVFTVLSVNVL